MSLSFRHFLLFGLAAAALQADPAVKTFAHPERIRYDGQCLTIDGRETFVFSAAFDYARSARPLWRERFRSLVKAGCNAVQTDVRASQRDLGEFKAWLSMAEDEFHLYAIIRPEADPQWMQTVCAAIAAEQVTRRPSGHGGVILVQIGPTTDLHALYRAARAGGVEVPLFTCLTAQCRDSSDPELGQVFDTVSSLPPLDIGAVGRQIQELHEAQPDAPAMVSDLQGGGLSSPQFNARALMAIQEGATLLNCDMGGRYSAIAAIGRALRTHGAALARTRDLACQSEPGSPDVSVVARRDRAGGTYIFVRNRSAESPRRGAAVVWIEHQGECRIGYDLGPLGFKVLCLPPKERDPARGEWLP